MPGIATAATLAAVLDAFGVRDPIVEFSPLGGGHIHRTWSVTAKTASDNAGYVLQDLNKTVFPDLAACEENLRRIDALFRSSDGGPATITVPRHLTAIDRDSIHATLGDGSVWRATERVEQCVAPTQITSEEQGYATAVAFGRFATVLRDLDGPPLRETIPRFHDFAWRVEQLASAVRTDRVGRAGSVRAELDHAERLVALVSRPAAAIATDRLHAVHNDAKVTNLLCDVATGLPAFVVDLDTTMPGSPLIDLGELVRSGASERPEDARDLDQIEARVGVIRALIDGFRSAISLDADQRELIPFAGPYLAVENGLRMLADHLNGDIYYRADRHGQNLDRARVQFRLADQLLRA